MPPSEPLPDTKHTSCCIKNAADDEPVFVLRAQDKLAPTLVRLWAQLVMLHEAGGTPKTLRAVELADRMEEWQEATGRAKWPD